MNHTRTAQLVSELYHICSRFSISNCLLIVVVQTIKNLQKFSAIVSTTQQRDDNLLGHNEEEKCKKLCVW